MTLPKALQLRLETLAMMNTHPLCLLRCPDMQIVDVNELFCKTLGLERQHIINQTFDELKITYPSHSDYKDIAKQVFVLPTRQAFRFIAIPLERDDTTFHLFVLTTQESVEQNVSKQAVVKSASAPRNFLSKLFYHSPVPAVITLLANHIVLEANQSFLELIGYQRQEILGRDVLKLRLLPDLKLFEAGERKLKQGKSALPVEQHLRCKNGLLRTVLVSAEPFDYNRQACAITTFVDITERKRTKEQLAKAIRAAIQDTEAFSHAVIEKLTELDRHAPDIQLYELTDREREVLGLLAKGFDNDYVAKKLFLSEHTVRNYITHIYEKLGLHSRAETIVWARERGLVSSFH